MIIDAPLTILVLDLDRSLRFYTETLGLTLRKRFDSKYAEIELGGFTIGLHLVEGDTVEADVMGNLSVGFRVEDLKAEVARLGEKGLLFSGTIQEGAGGWFAHFQDPDGTRLYLWQRRTY